MSTHRQPAPARKFIRPRRKRQVAGWLAWGVAALQGALLITLAVTPQWNPPAAKFFEIIWAWMHKPSFYPFVALLVLGPILTFLACQVKGLHRWWLAVCWSAFFVIIINLFGDRVLLMGRMLWWRFVE